MILKEGDKVKMILKEGDKVKMILKEGDKVKMILKEGDKVKLKKSTNFVSSRENPKIGSRYECAGKIIDIGKKSRMIIVKWNNGAVNNYALGHLMKIKRRSIVPDLNINSIW